MREYETIYVLKPDLPADIVKVLQDKLVSILAKEKGQVLVHTDWGKRKLAYRVDKFRHGQYLYLLYLDSGVSITELERILKYDDKVLKFLTVRLNDDVNVQERLATPVVAPLPPEEIGSYQAEEYGSGRDRDRGGGDYRRPDRPSPGGPPPAGAQDDMEDAGE